MMVSLFFIGCVTTQQLTLNEQVFAEARPIIKEYFRQYGEPVAYSYSVCLDEENDYFGCKSIDMRFNIDGKWYQVMIAFDGEEWIVFMDEIAASKL